jgi:hypothetical protein
MSAYLDCAEGLFVITFVVFLLHVIRLSELFLTLPFARTTTGIKRRVFVQTLLTDSEVIKTDRAVLSVVSPFSVQ